MIENLLAATHILVIKHNLGALYFNVSFYRIPKGGKKNFSLIENLSGARHVLISRNLEPYFGVILLCESRP